MVSKLLILLGIGDIHSRAKDCHSATVGVQRSAVGAESIPRAIPLTMTSPRAARSQERRSAIPTP